MPRRSGAEFRFQGNVEPLLRSPAATPSRRQRSPCTPRKARGKRALRGEVDSLGERGSAAVGVVFSGCGDAPAG